MKRKLIAAAWIGGATIPLFLATVFVVGCCVFPFHRAMHRLMPVCHLAANIMRGHQHDDRRHDHGDAPATPAREKQEPVKRLTGETVDHFRLLSVTVTQRSASPNASTDYRTFIALGAVRCDCDIGLHGFVQTFRI